MHFCHRSCASGFQTAERYPNWVRPVHWINAVSFCLLITSGWQIYNADPFWVGEFPMWLTLGEDLPSALRWHFFAMWILIVNGLVTILLLTISGRLQYLLRSLQIPRFRSVLLGHSGVSRTYEEKGLSALQILTYLAVLGLLVVETLTGLSIWKPIQLQSLSAFFGGYELSRRIHFACMSLLWLFFMGHLLLALASPNLLLRMLNLQHRRG